ncbi:NUDIX hydrolase [Rhodoferax sp. UBA5149]|uniref:NUDIX hydrolase n=1 Tax=Rhodoferax sp. UBA5149 TaxID=1947379 RepID=UPI0025D5EF08|nr:NUDIX domain-containing protein [Rhodoferax sp. UBA5149]
MELNSEVITTPPRPAATVVMLRDADEGLEVFLLKRHGLSDVLGGAYVFPGGKVDPSDAQLDMKAHMDQPLQALHAALNEPDIAPLTAASLYVAALREAFEESGILFAQGASAEHAAQATALLRTGHAFDAVLSHMGLRLQTSSVLPWSRWITPRMPSLTNKRFDTRFFVSAVPSNQIARHDNHETTASVWLQPRTALAQYWQGQIELAPPQIMSLAHLARHASVQSVLQAARSRLPPTIEPEPFEHEGARAICYPGDERHSVRAQALPGPTRLVYRNKRFEPMTGFDGLFD